nr:DUF1934 domain-containing protein [Oscillospiraceae bacterium]
MLKRVNLKIESVIDNLDPAGLTEGESERNVSESVGSLLISEENVRITYKEKTEGGESESEIICSGGGVTVRRRGAIESELYFKEGETHQSVYSVPPYKFDAEVKTRRVCIELSETGGRIDLFYNMKIGGAEKAARMKIWIS